MKCIIFIIITVTVNIIFVMFFSALTESNTDFVLKSKYLNF